MAVEFKATRDSPSSRLGFVFLRSEAFNRISRDRTYLRRTELSMPVAEPAKYFEMLDRARKGKFAYPAINVTSLTTANAVLIGLAESRSYGIIQVSTGGASFASGTAVKDMALGAQRIFLRPAFWVPEERLAIVVAGKHKLKLSSWPDLPRRQFASTVYRAQFGLV
jgi:hypothetical protein